LRLTFVSRGNLIRALSARKRATNDDPASSEKIHERGDDAVKRRISTFLSVRIFNPLVRAAARRGLPLFGVALLETRGRRTGRLRRNPVGLAVDGDTAWLVAEHGRRAAYVLNLEADPHVRVLWRRRWRAGSQATLPGRCTTFRRGRGTARWPA